MTDIQKRFFLFLFGCIGFRSFLVYFTKTTSKSYLKLLSYPALIISIGFLYLYFSGTRKTGPEVFGDKIWWNNLRPIHSLLYLLFAYFAFTGSNKAWQFLAIDVILGLFSFLYYHFKSGNMTKLFNS